MNESPFKRIEEEIDADIASKNENFESRLGSSPELKAEYDKLCTSHEEAKSRMEEASRKLDEASREFDEARKAMVQFKLDHSRN